MKSRVAACVSVATKVAIGFYFILKDLAQDVAEDVLGAAKDRGVKVLILPIIIFQRRNPRPTHVCRAPRLPSGDT